MRQTLAFERTTPEPGADADAVWHEFVATFTLAVEDFDHPIRLEIEGLATDVELHLNGRLQIVEDSMFDWFVADLAGDAQVGTNTVTVTVRPLAQALANMPRKPRARWRTMLTDEPQLRWIRTSILGRAPGFAPAPPVVGPFRPMTVVTGPQGAPSRLSARLDGETGVVELIGRQERLVVSLRGEPVAEGRGRVGVPHAERWWPHTHGEPVLYDVELPDGRTRRVGFRELENRSDGSVDLWLNGVRVFCRGAVWTPGDLSALDRAVELGLNMVRVPGVGAYESDAFHARCDELGLLVWQDLMFATFDYPLADPEFAHRVSSEVRGQATRWRAHASTVVVCGSAEHEQQAAMFGISPSTGYAKELAGFTRPLVEASGLDAVWVDSSPTGGDPPIRTDVGVAQYFGVGAYLRGLPDVRHSQVKFAAECLAFSNLPDPVVDGGVPRDNGADWDFADVREHYLRERYGADASEAEAQRVTGEVMADVFGEWRRPDSGCGGGIVLWLRDLRPGAGWGLLDHESRPKPAALALAPTLQSTAVWLVDEGLNGIAVHVGHDGPAAANLSLAVELLREDGSVLEAAERELAMTPHGHWMASVEQLVGHFVDSAYAYRFGPAQHAAVRARLTGPFGERTATWRVP